MRKPTNPEIGTTFRRRSLAKRAIALILVFSLLLSVAALGADSFRKQVLPTTDAVSMKDEGTGEDRYGPRTPQLAVDPDDPFYKTIATFDSLLASGDEKGAEHQLMLAESLCKDDLQRAMLAVDYGRLFYKQGDYERALLSYKKAEGYQQTVFTPADLCFAMARCHLLLEDTAAAIADCDRGIAALQDGQNGAELYILRGTAKQYDGDCAGAVKDYQKALDLGYEDAESLKQEIAVCSGVSNAATVGDETTGEAAGGKTDGKTGGSTSGKTTVTPNGSPLSGIDKESQMSLAYYALGMYKEAAKSYETLLQKGSNYYTKAQIYSALSKCYIFTTDYSLALTRAQEGIALNDKSELPTLYALSGTARMATADYAGAAQDFETANRKGYEKPQDLLAQSAASYYYAGMFRQAIDEGEKALSYNGGGTDAILWIALSYYQMEDYTKAVEWLEKARGIDQIYCEKTEILRCLVRSYLLLENYDALYQTADAALSSGGSGSGKADIYVLRGAARLSQANYKEALSDFYAGIALGYGDTYEIYRQATLCHFLLGEYDQAVQCGERALDNGEGEFDLYYWIAMAYFSQAKYGQALPYFNTCLEKGTGQENIQFYIGVCHFAQGSYQTAISAFDASIAKGESAEKSEYNKALCLLQLEQYSEAKTLLLSCTAQSKEAQVAADAQDLLDKLKDVLP